MSTTYDSNVNLPDKFVVNLPDKFFAPAGPPSVDGLTFERDHSLGGFVYLASKPARTTSVARVHAGQPEAFSHTASPSSEQEEEMSSRTYAKRKARPSRIQDNELNEVEGEEGDIVSLSTLAGKFLPLLGIVFIAGIITQSNTISSAWGVALFALQLVLIILSIRAWISKSRT